MTKFEIPEPVRFALTRLHEAGHEAYVVGGCVRDFLMGRTPGDYDVTTSAKPDRIINVFDDCRVVETGLKHGTVTLVHGGMNIEITTYRVDGEYRDGRHPENVSFTNDLAEDLCRRDFTVNAMAYAPETGVIDLHGGLSDMKNGVISCVGSAEKRFTEDGLRILRALRFSSVLDFTPDAECAEAVHRLSYLLDKISRERIYAEMTKLLRGVAAVRILREYSDVFGRIFAGIGDTYRASARILRLRGFFDEVDIGDSPEITKPCQKTYDSLNYALLFADSDDETCRRLMNSLKPSRDERDAVLSIHRYGESGGADDVFATEDGLPYAVKRLMKAGGDDFPLCVAMYKYSCERMTAHEAEAAVRTAAETIRDGACVRLDMLHISGGDLIERGFRGAEVGRVLNSLLDGVMRGDLSNERDTLIRAADEMRGRL